MSSTKKDNLDNLVYNLQAERQYLLDCVVESKLSPLEMQCTRERLEEINFILEHNLGRVLYFFLQQIRKRRGDKYEST